VNRNREVLTLQHQLIVEVPPYIESLHPLNGSITVHSGSRVRLECRAGGQPPPTVYWKRLVSCFNILSPNNDFCYIRSTTSYITGTFSRFA
jgi:hypothetical protein